MSKITLETERPSTTSQVPDAEDAQRQRLANALLTGLRERHPGTVWTIREP